MTAFDTIPRVHALPTCSLNYKSDSPDYKEIDQKKWNGEKQDVKDQKNGLEKITDKEPSSDVEEYGAKQFWSDKINYYCR